jgi:hypothetical protein
MLEFRAIEHCLLVRFAMLGVWQVRVMQSP